MNVVKIVGSFSHKDLKSILENKFSSHSKWSENEYFCVKKIDPFILNNDQKTELFSNNVVSSLVDDDLEIFLFINVEIEGGEIFLKQPSLITYAHSGVHPAIPSTLTENQLKEIFNAPKLP